DFGKPSESWVILQGFTILFSQLITEIPRVPGSYCFLEWTARILAPIAVATNSPGRKSRNRFNGQRLASFKTGAPSPTWILSGRSCAWEADSLEAIRPLD